MLSLNGVVYNNGGGRERKITLLASLCYWGSRFVYTAHQKLPTELFPLLPAQCSAGLWLHLSSGKSELFTALFSRDFHTCKHLGDKGRTRNEYKCKGQREK